MRISDWSSDVCSSDLLYNRIGRPRPSSTHDRPRDMTDFDRSMRGTLGSGASRILNVAQTTRRLEVAADSAGGGPPGRLLFGHRGLNRAVFIKRPREMAPPRSSPQAAVGEILDGRAQLTESGRQPG